MEYTKQAQIEQRLIKMLFPTLWKHYQTKMGNFIFTPDELKQNISAITRWIEEFEDYMIICQKNEGKTYFFLTDYLE